jgi:hypothetical protein
VLRTLVVRTGCLLLVLSWLGGSPHISYSAETRVDAMARDAETYANEYG